MNPLISVIIPVYNVEKYLNEALDSIINQTYHNLEIIIIDDGSSDGSGKICDEYAILDNRVRVFHTENRGLSAARNLGLNNMSGQIVSFFDPDDAFHPNMIQRLFETMRLHNTNISICKFNCYDTQNKMNIDLLNRCYEDNVTLYNKKDVMQKILNMDINTAVWDKLYDRSIWDDLRFPEGVVYEGTLTIFKIFEQIDKVAILDSELIMHRIRGGSICNTNSVKNIKDMLKAREYFTQYIKEHTPVFFTEEQLLQCQQSRLNGMIYTYIVFSRNNNIENIYFINKLKEQIIEFGRHIGFCDLSMRTKIAIFLLDKIPSALRIVYIIYHPIWHIFCEIKNSHKKFRKYGYN